MAQPIHFTVELNDIKDLFVAPDYDPFDEKCYEKSGLDIISNYLEAHPIPTPASATIYLPPEQITPDLPERFQAALQRFKDRRVLSNKNEMLSSRNDGWRTSVYALVLTIIVGAVFYALISVIADEVIDQLLASVMVIVLWVIVWWPVETLIFDNLAPRRMNRVWKKIGEMPFEFKPSPAPAGSVGITGTRY